MTRTLIILTALAAAVATVAMAVFMHNERAGDNSLEPTPNEQQTTKLMEPGLYPVPSFELTNQSKRSYTSSELDGRIWIAGFIFTRCQLICPVMSARFVDLQNKLAETPGGDKVRLVCFSVDPQNDTPQLLMEYAHELGADLQRWVFLTGDKDTIWSICENGFLLPVEDDPDNDLMPISHSAKLALVDRQGWIRGYYSSLDTGEMDLLMNDICRLIDEPIE